MLEQSNLSPVLRDAARRHAVYSDTAEAILRDRGWKVYRALKPDHLGNVSVFCRNKFSTRIVKVSSLEIEARLHSHL